MKEQHAPALVTTLAVVSTAVFSLILPWTTLFSNMSWLVFDAPNTPGDIGMLYVALFYALPMSIPILLSLLWYNYGRRRYRRALVYSFSPLLAFILWFPLATIVDKLVQLFFKQW